MLQSVMFLLREVAFAFRLIVHTYWLIIVYIYTALKENNEDSKTKPPSPKP